MGESSTSGQGSQEDFSAQDQLGGFTDTSDLGAQEDFASVSQLGGFFQGVDTSGVNESGSPAGQAPGAWSSSAIPDTWQDQIGPAGVPNGTLNKGGANAGNFVADSKALGPPARAREAAVYERAERKTSCVP